MSISGLHGEERWEYCDAILRDLGLVVNRDDPQLVELMELLEGHPLAMRVILPRLEKSTPSDLIAAVKTNLQQFASDDDSVPAKLFATLRFAEESLPDDLKPLFGGE